MRAAPLYDSNIQALPLGVADVVRNLRLRRHRTITAGQSIVILIERDSSLAIDLDSMYAFDHVWEFVDVVSVGTGTLTVEARPAEAGGIVPNMFFGFARPPGTLSIPVEAGRVYGIGILIPTWAAPQRYEVFTSLQP